MSLDAIFLDRDGTINYDFGYVGDPEKVEILPGVIDGLKKLSENFPNIKFIVISNQSGVARGLITMEDVNKVNTKIQNILSAEGIEISKFYVCPFHPEFSDEKDVTCRKPSPEMVLQAVEDFNLNPSDTYFIGDRTSDIECGKNAGTKTILLASDKYKNELEILNKKNISPDFYAKDFTEAVNWIIENEVNTEN